MQNNIPGHGDELAPDPIHKSLGVPGHVRVDKEDPEPGDFLERRNLAVIEFNDSSVGADRVVHARGGPVQDFLREVRQATDFGMVLGEKNNRKFIDDFPVNFTRSLCQMGKATQFLIDKI